MDSANEVLVLLGISGTLVLALSGIIKNTIDNFRGSYEWDGKICVGVCYALSMLLAFLALSLTVEGNAIPEMLRYIVQSVVTGWLTANQAGMLTDSHNRARQTQQLERNEEIEEVIVVPDPEPKSELSEDFEEELPRPTL